jgi:hypothetical protein
MFFRLPLNIQDQGRWKLVRVLKKMTAGYHDASPHPDTRDKVYHPTAVKSITAFIDFLGRKKYLLGGFRNPIRSDKTPAKEE